MRQGCICLLGVVRWLGPATRTVNLGGDGNGTTGAACGLGCKVGRQERKSGGRREGRRGGRIQTDKQQGAFLGVNAMEGTCFLGTSR
jgi:hypothetical protein